MRVLRKLGYGAAVVGLTALGALVAPGAAGATTAPDCKTVTAAMVRPDSGLSGNWATDTFDRTAKVCHVVVEANARAVEVQSWTYSVEVSDTGTFTTDGVKSFKGATMAPGVVGSFRGSLAGPDGTLAYKGTFDAPKDWGLWLGKVADGNKYGTSAWVEHLWSDGFKAGAAKFAWTYQVCNEKLTNASAGNTGDITGLSKRPCYGNPSVVSNCDGTLSVILTNGAPSASSKALYWVSGVEANKGFIAVAGGKPGTVTVKAKPDTHGTVTVKYDRQVKRFTYKKPVCTSPSPSTSASPASPGVPPVDTSSGSLPVTGFKVAGAALIGTGLVLAGVALVVGRKRRTVFEA